MGYLSNISQSILSIAKGMSLSISYFLDARKKRPIEYLDDDNYYKKAAGIFTVQYPKESIPVPDNGRYLLHNEIDDCIVCDKCAKICPVDCIDIEPVRATEAYGKTSDGTPLRIYPAKFDIDMSKCCFCGLCTVVCPTECLTMTKEYDFSTTDILDHNFSFSKMSEKEIEEKKLELENFRKEEATPAKSFENKSNKMESLKPVFKPKVPPLKTKVSATDEKPTKPIIKVKIPKKK